MFKRTSSENELMDLMHKNLLQNIVEEKGQFVKKEAAINHLNSAAEIFDDLGLYKEAEIVTKFLEVLANDKYTDNLSPEKMVENLKHTGTVFDYSADDGEDEEFEDEENK